ncbi:MAG: mucoidy inhibitor MuiA family protein [Halothiobacillus sp.]
MMNTYNRFLVQSGRLGSRVGLSALIFFGLGSVCLSVSAFAAEQMPSPSTKTQAPSEALLAVPPTERRAEPQIAATLTSKISPSKMTAVTVLPDGAWITRRVEVRWAGSDIHTIELADLPPSVQQDSVQIEGNGITLAAPLQWSQQPVEQSAVYRHIQQQLSGLRGAQAKADDGLEAARMRLAIFQAQMSAPNALVHKYGAPAGAFLTESSARKKFDRLLTQLLAAQRTAQDEVTEVQRKTAELDEALKKRHSQGERLLLSLPLKLLTQKKTAQQTTSESAEAAVPVLIRYRVNDARWQPIYRANLHTMPLSETATTPAFTLAPTPATASAASTAATNAAVDWSLSALVSQNTGEDWSRIPLTLSLLDTRRYYPVPKLPRWVIGFNAPSSAAAAPRADLAASMKTMAMSEALLTPHDETGFNAVFKSADSVSIPSGAAASLIPLLHQQVAANATILIAPEISPQAILTGEFTLDNKIPLPAGQWQLFLNGAQLSQVFQPALKPIQKQHLSFGVDQRLSVTFDQLPDQRDENGVIGKSSQLIRRSVVMIQSQHSNPVAVTVVMNLPTAEDAEISVEPLTDNTPPTLKQYNGEEGVWAWSNQIKPDQKVSINFGFRLRWPADKTLHGL